MSSPLTTIIMILFKYFQLVMKFHPNLAFQLFLTHNIFNHNNHNRDKVENDTFRRNSLQSDFLIGLLRVFGKVFMCSETDEYKYIIWVQFQEVK